MKLAALLEHSNAVLLKVQQQLIDLLPEEWSVGISADRKLRLTVEGKVKAKSFGLHYDVHYDVLDDASDEEHKEEVAELYSSVGIKVSVAIREKDAITVTFASITDLFYGGLAFSGNDVADLTDREACAIYVDQYLLNSKNVELLS